MRYTRLLASLALTVSLGSFATTASAAADPTVELFYKPMVTQVPERATATLATFREAQPVTVPQIVNWYGAPDPATGKTLLGMNVALARPTYPFGKSDGKPHFWLAPAFDNSVAAFEFDSKGHEVEEGGFNARIDSRFEKYGFLDWEEPFPPFPGSKLKRTKIRALVPDSIKSFKIITKRKKKKSLTKTYKVQGNAIILDLKNPTYIVLGGRKTRLHYANPPDSGEFNGEYFN